MVYKTQLSTLKEIDKVADYIIELLNQSGNSKQIVAFFGNMGVGKTTLIKAICKNLGVTDPVNSPTFSIINEYNTIDAEKIYHFDFYRINKSREAMEIGLEEYLYSNSLCLMEWPEKIIDLLPPYYVAVRISENNDLSRNIEIDIPIK